MKKVLLLLFIASISLMPCQAKTDKISKDYLKNKKHLAILNPLAENVAEKVIKKALKKEIGDGNYKVKFEGYTFSSMKKGVFKNLEITGKNLTVEEIPIPYLYLKNKSDYNWIDFNEDPIKVKSDINFFYNLELTEKSINAALQQKEYKKVIEKLNLRAYPLFTMHDVVVRIKNNKTYIIMEYTLPLASTKKKRKFMVSSDFKVVDGKIQTKDVSIDKVYGNLPLDKVINLVNIIDPLNFTLGEINDDNCKGKVSNVKIEDDIIKVDGEIWVKPKSEEKAR